MTPEELIPGCWYTLLHKDSKKTWLFHHCKMMGKIVRSYRHTDFLNTTRPNGEWSLAWVDSIENLQIAPRDLVLKHFPDAIIPDMSPNYEIY